MVENIVPNIITSVSALPKSGKTYLGFTWPDPIKSYSFDLGAAYIAKKFFPSKKIDIHEFSLPIIETDNPAPYAEKVWDEFQKEFKADVYGGKYQTVIVDTATALWAIIRQAITEAKNRKKLLEVEYALPNLKMSALFSHARVSGVNLVTIQYLRDKYVNGDNTGQLELDGWKQTAGQADIVLEMSRVSKGGKCQMQTMIVDNRFDRDVNGKTFLDTNYEELTTILFGGS
jgi:hypothetical protein